MPEHEVIIEVIVILVGNSSTGGNTRASKGNTSITSHRTTSTAYANAHLHAHACELARVYACDSMSWPYLVSCSMLS